MAAPAPPQRGVVGMVQKQVTLWLSGQAFFLEMKNVCRLPTLGLFKEPSHQEEADVYSHSTTTSTQRPLPDNRSCPANGLNPLQRQRLACHRPTHKPMTRTSAAPGSLRSRFAAV